MKLKLITITLFLILFQLTSCRQLQSDNQIEIEGSTNETLQVAFQTEQIVEVSIKNKTLPKYLQIVPKRFKLSNKKGANILPFYNKSLLQDLRSPFTQQYTQFLQLNETLVAFQPPNHFILIKQTDSSFEIIKEYTYKELLKFDQQIPNILIIENSYVLLILSQKQVYIFNQTFSKKQTNPFQTTEYVVIKQLFYQNSTYFLSVINNTVLISTINNGNFTIVKYYNLTQQNISISVSAIQRGQFSKKRQQIWLLDSSRGVFLMVISSSLQIVTYPFLIQQQKGCFELDTKKQTHSFSVLLSCRSKGFSNFIYFIYDNDDIKFPFLLQKQDPYYQKCNTNRYMFYKNNIFSLQPQSLDIFVPDRPTNNKSQYKKNWVTLQGINDYLIKTNQLKNTVAVYILNKGNIQKTQLQLQNYSLSIYSQQPVSASIPITLSYLCGKANKQQVTVCQLEITIKLNIHSKIVSYVQYKSINIALVLILATVLIALVVLCRYKYNSIYKKAYQDLKALTNPTKCQI